MLVVIASLLYPRREEVGLTIPFEMARGLTAVRRDDLIRTADAHRLVRRAVEAAGDDCVTDVTEAQVRGVVRARFRSRGCECPELVP